MRTVSLREKEAYKTIAGLFYGFPFREAELQTHRPQGDTTTLGAKGPVKLKNLKNIRDEVPSTLMCAFCIECASQPKLALSRPIKGPSYCRLTVRRRVPQTLFP